MKLKNDTAVSEVVGVLIMVTVTIILAGVVALAVTGTVSNTEKPLDSQIAVTAQVGNDVLFELISGDSFTLSDIKVSLGIREDSTASVSVFGSALEGVSGEVITLGERFPSEWYIHFRRNQLWGDDSTEWRTPDVSVL